MVLDLAPHQLKAIRELDNGKVLKGGVGVGKSRTALAYFVAKECGGSFPFNGKGEFRHPTAPKDLYIFTTKKKKDKLEWEEEGRPFNLSPDPKNSLGGIKVTVDTWNNIHKYIGVENAFFIFDEQRLVGSGAWVKSFLAIAKKNRWIVLSATPGDTWMDYIAIFIANGFYKNRTEFVKRHVVYSAFHKYPKISRYTEEAVLERYRRQLLVEMPFLRHTKRHIRHILVEYDMEAYKRLVVDRWNIFEDRPIENVAELYLCIRRLVNSDVSRIAGVHEILEKHPRLIIFYNFNYELEILRILCRSLNYPFSEWNGQKHEDIEEGEKWIYLVQYTAGAEGWNCITTDAELLFSLNYSYKIFEQVQGRIDRMNTPFTDLYYYILRSKAPIDSAIMKAIASKKNFNERSLYV